MEYNQQTTMCAISIFFSFQGCQGTVWPTYCNNVQAEFNQIQPGHCRGTFRFVPPPGRRPLLLRQPRSAIHSFYISFPTGLLLGMGGIVMRKLKSIFGRTTPVNQDDQEDNKAIIAPASPGWEV